VAAAFIIVDSVATVTFRWKEYGELTHRYMRRNNVAVGACGTSATFLK
jgi:hypothetical protein